MPIKVTLTNSSSVTKRNPSEDTGGESNIQMSRSTYQYLGSLVRNRGLKELYESGNLPGEYVRFLDEMNNLYLYKNYPEIYSDLELADGIEELDEYLGSLGIDTEYPYSKDTVDIPTWLNDVETANVRVLVDDEDVLYDPLDGTILARII